MPFEPGQTVLHYRVLEKIGEGGMGVVFRALDTTLDREVAVKVLPDAFLSSPERLARFEREARVLASLSHPSIATVHSVHESGGRRFLAMELVPGEDLARRLGRGPVPLEDALRIALHVAEALEAAHESGVVHRDLKPANIRLMPDGRAKVLDFGLAKALVPDLPDGEASFSPTLTSAGTIAGALMGTAGYMSPEQARGEAVDRRADIWAFGCVLFELLSGARTFPGRTATDAIAAIIERPPDWESLPAATPRRVRELLRRCLKKNAQVRLRDIGEARIVLREVLESGARGDAGDGEPIRPSPGRRVLPWALTAAFAVLALVGFLGRPTPPPPAPPARLTVALEEGRRLDAGRENLIFAMARDGTALVFAAREGGTSRLYYRPISRREASPLPDTEGAESPFFSPDGEWVAFFAGGKLRKVSVRGGAAVDLCETSFNRGGVWVDEGTLVIAPNYASPLVRVPAAGGDPEPLTRLDEAAGERTHRWPDLLGAGPWVVFTVGAADSPAAYDDATVATVSLATGERRDLLHGGSMARWAAPDHLVWARHGSLLTASLDPDDPRPVGPPRPVLEGVSSESSSGAAHFAVGTNGLLAYIPGSPGELDADLVWVDREGRVDATPAPRRHYETPRVSPDGKRIAVVVGPAAIQGDIWIYDLERDSLNRFTFDGTSGAPLWLPDGSGLVYASGTNFDRLFVKPLGGGTERLVTRQDWPISPSSITPDGTRALFSEFGPTNTDIYEVDLGSGETARLLGGRSREWGAAVSPDGRWVAYVSDESGRAEVYVQPLAGEAGKLQVSSDGGDDPGWGPDGREISYSQGDAMMAAGVELRDGGLSVGAPLRLFTMPSLPRLMNFRHYDRSPDGRRFLFPRSERAQRRREIEVILGWGPATLDAPGS